MGVKPRRDKDELGRKLPQPGQRLAPQDFQILGIATPDRQEAGSG